MRARSPIEMMVDKACGFDPNAPMPPRGPIKCDDPETQAVVDVCEAAAAWATAIDADEHGVEAVHTRLALLAAAKRLVATGW